ncbi:MAG: YgjV family protein [Ferruginibacter sp.]
MIQLILGYIASILLAISLIVNNDLKFRWLNTLGCLAFIIYGILISALPVILTNSLLLLINGFYLVKIYRTKENFDLLEFEPGVTLVNRFLSFYKEDIKNYFPGFQEIVPANNIRFVVLRDIVIANIFAATLQDDGTAEVNLNYTVAKYRDYKVGKFIFDKEKTYLISKGVKQLKYSQAINKKHQQFLTVMGFKKIVEGGKECFVKTLL